MGQFIPANKNTTGYFQSLKEGSLCGELINNSTIHYIPEALKADDLLKYRDLIMQKLGVNMQINNRLNSENFSIK